MTDIDNLVIRVEHNTGDPLLTDDFVGPKPTDDSDPARAAAYRAWSLRQGANALVQCLASVPLTQEDKRLIVETMAPANKGPRGPLKEVTWRMSDSGYMVVEAHILGGLVSVAVRHIL